MDMDLILKILILIVVVGLTFKAIKAITGLVFKVAIILLVVLLIYRFFL